MVLEKKDVELETMEVHQESIDNLQSPLDLAAARVAVRKGYVKVKEEASS